MAADLGLRACSTHRRLLYCRLGLVLFFILSAVVAVSGGVSGKGRRRLAVKMVWPLRRLLIFLQCVDIHDGGSGVI